MFNLWLNFAAMFLVQIFLFIVHAYFEKRLADVPRILWQGALSGIVPGLLCDLIFGKYLGLATYALGFGPLFLILNAVLLYGIFAANVLMMQHARLLHFCIWTTVVVTFFEITNLFTLSYTYAFAVPSLEYIIVAFVGPLGVAIVISLSWHILFGYRFVFIDNMQLEGLTPSFDPKFQE